MNKPEEKNSPKISADLLTGRPVGMDFDVYKKLLKIQNKFIRKYLQNGIRVKHSLRDA